MVEPCWLAELLPEASRLPGTSFAESGRSVRVRPERGETWRFFGSDSESVRAVLGIERACDVVVGLCHGRLEEDLVIAVELKGTHLDHAATQLEATLRTLRAKQIATHPRAKVRYRAVAVCGGAAPRQHADAQQRLAKIGCVLQVGSTKSHDLRMEVR